MADEDGEPLLTSTKECKRREEGEREGGGREEEEVGERKRRP